MEKVYTDFQMYYFTASDPWKTEKIRDVEKRAECIHVFITLG